MSRTWMLAFAMLLAVARSGYGQVTVRADRDLNFGFVPAGIAKSIAPTDPVSSGQWTLIMTAGDHIKLTFTLPTVLREVASTATMTITYAGTDAFLQETGGAITTFNPAGQLNYKFTVSNTAIVRLGGKVSPTAGQAFGTYQNSVVITVVILN